MEIRQKISCYYPVTGNLARGDRLLRPPQTTPPISGSFRYPRILPSFRVLGSGAGGLVSVRQDSGAKGWIWPLSLAAAFVFPRTGEGRSRGSLPASDPFTRICFSSKLRESITGGAR